MIGCTVINTQLSKREKSCLSKAALWFPLKKNTGGLQGPTASKSQSQPADYFLPQNRRQPGKGAQRTHWPMTLQMWDRQLHTGDALYDISQYRHIPKQGGNPISKGHGQGIRREQGSAKPKKCNTSPAWWRGPAIKASSEAKAGGSQILDLSGLHIWVHGQPG